MKHINEINLDTEDGRLLLAAVSILTTTEYTDKEPDKVLEIITERSDLVNGKRWKRFVLSEIKYIFHNSAYELMTIKVQCGYRSLTYILLFIDRYFGFL